MKKFAIGYTSGVFDLFHIGHLNALRAEKELCSYLIVGVNTDEHVMEYKKKKPVIPFEERFAIIEAIKYVDMAVAHTGHDRMRVWEQFDVGVIFTGSDWKGSERWNNYEKQFKSVGVDVIYIPYTDGCSSTLLSNRLRKLQSICDIARTDVEGS